MKQEEMFSSRDVPCVHCGHSIMVHQSCESGGPCGQCDCEDGTTVYQMRSPCPFCGARNGKLSRSGAHWRVDCAPCDRYMYFAPVSEVEANRKTEGTP